MLGAVARKVKSKKQPMVVSRHGKHRFQTGMITADLLRRGLRMADAVKIARAVRDSVAGKGSITTDKLNERIDALMTKQLGPDRAALATPPRTIPPGEAPRMVVSAHGTFPFSKGDVLRHLDTSGVGLEAASKLALRVDEWARSQPGDEPLSEERVHEEAAEMLRASHGGDFARRYRLTGWVRRSEKPVIILLGGATGTGKSTLAMELAYRLGVVWVVSTDMIRETMRTVISPELVPGLHDHSFRGMVLGGHALSDPRERVLAGFHSQSAQVTVGVRAVISRAIREQANLIIEGTHLTPPFRRYLQAGDDAHLAGLVLAVPDEREHRRRFPKRTKEQTSRIERTYLDAFQSVRWVHDDLLRIAEDMEAVVLGNEDLTDTLTGAVEFLCRELPVEADTNGVPRDEAEAAGPDVPTLFLILDGLSDEPNPALGGKTPLAAAETPVLRKLAATGGQGLIMTSADDGHVPATDEGIMALLGGTDDEPLKLGRGMYEALGLGLPIPAGAVLLRGNLATVEPDGAVVDRRAGRIRAGVADLLAGLHDVALPGGVTGRIFAGHEHRVVVMLQGPSLSAAVANTDPGSLAAVQRVAPPSPTDDSTEAARTAEALGALLTIASEQLRDHPLNLARVEQGLRPATGVITRGAAMAKVRRSVALGNGAMVSGCNTALGVARYIGMQTASSDRLTGNLSTDLDAKFEIGGKLFDDVDLVTVHIKGTDIAGHDRRPLEKRDFIESIDAALGRFLTKHPELSDNLRIVVAADHGTSSLTGNHIAQPVPLLLATWQHDSDDESTFDEESAAHGALGLLHRGELAELLGIGSRTSS
jgi:2,3-bisphosphoglycerate-independent phosphoglycerate mutase